MQDPTINKPDNSKSSSENNETQTPVESGESKVQEGEEIVNQEEQNVVVNDEAQEIYLDNVINVSVPADQLNKLNQ